MRVLWLHRSIELVQNKIHNHIFNPTPGRRHEILRDWKSIQYEFIEIIKEMDAKVDSYKCLGIFQEKAINTLSLPILQVKNIPKKE